MAKSKGKKSTTKRDEAEHFFPEDESWEEVGNFWDQMYIFERAADFIEGTLLGKADGIGPNNSMVYILEYNGERYGVWGCTILDSRMKDVEIGRYIRITYTGMAVNPKTEREYKEYKVFARK